MKLLLMGVPGQSLMGKPWEQDKLLIIYLKTGRNWIWIPIRVIKGEEKPGQERMQVRKLEHEGMPYKGSQSGYISASGTGSDGYGFAPGTAPGIATG